MGIRYRREICYRIGYKLTTKKLTTTEIMFLKTSKSVGTFRIESMIVTQNVAEYGLLEE